MAIDNRLKVYDEQGNPVDYDILASDVKFLPDGKDLPTKLAEMEQEIEDAGSGDGTVTGVKVGNTTYEPTEGVVDLSTPINTKVDKNGTDSLMTAAEHTKLQNLPTATELTTQLGQKANDNAVVKSVSVNGQTPQTPTNGNVNLEVSGGSSVDPATSTPQMDGTAAVGSSSKYAREDHVHPHDTTKLSKSDVSVETQGDGTVDINVKDDTYTVNLNHTHENMAKLVVCEESDLPSTLDPATIYAITDSGETEIEKLIIKGMEFAGGGIPDTGEPMISLPSNGSTINLGTNEGSGVSKTITVKGKNLTGDLTVAVGTGLTISYGQSTGQSSVTIPMAQALRGAQVTISYSGSGALADGSLLISHGNDVLSSVVVVVVEAPVSLAAVKLTGTQWLQTDYCPNANTEFEMELKFDSVNNFQTGKSVFLSCAKDGDYRWFVFNGTDAGGKYQVAIQPETSDVAAINYKSNQSAMLADHSILKYYKDGANAKLTFLSGGVTEQTTNAAVKTTTMAQPMAIGYSHLSNEPYANFELTIYRLTIKENGVTVRNYVPAKLRGVPGLHETVSDTFISSETSSELVAIEIS